MSEKNKIKYGLKNVHYAVATINEEDNTATYGTPKRMRGGVSLSMDPQTEDNIFHADNIDYYVDNSSGGYDGDLEMAVIGDEFRKDIFGDIEDDNGVLFEDANAQTVHFALLFQFEGDVKATRHVLYNCTAKRTSIKGQTKEESVSPETETVPIASKPIHNSLKNKDLTKAKTNEATDATVYNNWFEQVYQGANGE